MIVVEVLGRGGRVESRVRLAALPATIGRGYGSDVIVDDPYVDAAHARLVAGEADTIVAEDLGSANGLARGEHGERENRLVLRPGAVFRVGRTLLRVATPDTPVVAALVDARSGSRGRRLAHDRRAALLLTPAGAALFGTIFYLGSADRAGGGDFLAGVLLALVFVPLWAGGWALATRMRTGQGRFLAHLTVAWLVFAALWGVEAGETWVRFFVEDSPLADVAGVLALTAGVTALLYGHLAVATELSRTRRAAIGLVATVAFLALAWAVDRAGLADDHADIRIAMPLKPVSAALIPTETAEEFLERAARLQVDVDAEAEK